MEYNTVFMIILVCWIIIWALTLFAPNNVLYAGIEMIICLFSLGLFLSTLRSGKDE